MRSRTNKLRALAATYWQPTVFYGMLIVFFGLLLWFRLAVLVGGYSGHELETAQISTSLRHIIDNPINAPFTIVAYLFGLLHIGNSLFDVRAAATVYGLLTLTTFYWLVRLWHGERSAILGTVVFGCSAWFLHIARLGTPEVLLFILLTLAASSVWLKHTDNRLILLGGFGLAATLLYIPGAIWLLVVGTIWQFKTVKHLFKEHLNIMAIGSLGFLALSGPLVWAIYQNHVTAKIMLGLPATGWPDPVQSLQRLAHVPYNLLIRGPLDAEHWLGRLPFLDAFSIVMLIFGVYLYLRHWRLVRSKMVGAALVLGAVLIAVGGAVTISIVMPFVYVLIAAGIGFMLDRWQQVFPRNVIAQTVSIALISLAVIASSWYGLRHYFVAWPNAPATKQVFVNKQ
jgi:hypothetical protein